MSLLWTYSTSPISEWLRRHAPPDQKEKVTLRDQERGPGGQQSLKLSVQLLASYVRCSQKRMCGTAHHVIATCERKKKKTIQIVSAEVILKAYYINIKGLISQKGKMLGVNLIYALLQCLLAKMR